MKQSTVQEIRNHRGKLFAKYYPRKGVIEIANKGNFLQIIIPPGTQMQFNSSTVSVEQTESQN